MEHEGDIGTGHRETQDTGHSQTFYPMCKTLDIHTIVYHVPFLKFYPKKVFLAYAHVNQNRDFYENIIIKIRSTLICFAASLKMVYQIPNVIMEVSHQEENNHYETVSKQSDQGKMKVCNSMCGQVVYLYNCFAKFIAYPEISDRCFRCGL